MRVPADPADTPALERPQSLWALFWAFSTLALQGFGGVLAIVQRDLVERKRWLTREEFVEEWAVAQILPGPNVINLSLMLGDRYFGMRGAFVALAGMLTFPLVAILALAALFAGVADMPAAQGALRGIGAVAAGLIAATGLRLVSALRSNLMGRWVCGAAVVATFVLIAILRLPLVWVLFGLGGVCCIWAWICIGRQASRQSVGNAP